MSRFLFRTLNSDPISIDNHSIQIESKQLLISFPYGGFSYQLPTAVTDLNTDERQPIYDVTRIAILSIVAISFLFAILFAIITRRSK